MNFPPLSENSWALITGSSSGIGEVFAKRFAREGWNVALVARSTGKLEALGRSLETDNRIKALVIPADLTDRDVPRQVYDAVRQKGIVVDALVNNAGSGAAGRFSEVSLTDYLSMIDLNIRSLVELTHLFFPEMMTRRRGLILNISSTACFQPLPFSSVYAATKAFVTSFSEALWLETKGTGIRVLNLCPGLTKTDFGVRAGFPDFHLDPHAENPEQVVETAFRALRGNVPTAISGWKNKVLVFLERFVPHRLLLPAVMSIQKIRGHV